MEKKFKPFIETYQVILDKKFWFYTINIEFKKRKRKCWSKYKDFDKYYRSNKVNLPLDMFAWYFDPRDAECKGQEENISRAEKLRASLMHQYIQFDHSLKQLYSNYFNPKESNMFFQLLLKNIYFESSQYLQSQMLKLPSLPKPPQKTVTSPIILPSAFENNIYSEKRMEDKEESASASIISSTKWFKKLVNNISSPMKGLLFSGDGELVDEPTRVLYVEHRCQLEEQLQTAIRNGKFEAVQPLRDAIENIDSMLRKEYL